MRGEKKIRAALPHLSARELWFAEIDAHRAANVAAIGGASEAEWRKYVNLEEDIKKERQRRYPESKCPFPSARVDGWKEAEYDEMNAMYRRIFAGKAIVPTGGGAR